MSIDITNIIRTLAQVKVSPGELGIQENDPTRATTVPIVLRVVFGFAGALALLMIVIGGFRFVISRGDPSNTSKARNTIIYALVGLVVVLLSYSIVNFVYQRLK